MAHENATPRPWRFSPWHIEEDASAVRAPEGWIVCTTSSDADAALIVKAVNCHDELLDALQSCFISICVAATLPGVSAEYDFSDAMSVAQAALAKASASPSETEAGR